jgi:CheY-like chemotaxis protein
MASTCMIVEHDPWVMRLLAMYGERMGLRLIQVFDGAAALMFAGQESPDVIIVDINLPGSIGYYDVIEALQNNMATRNIPVVIAMPTGRGGAEIQIECVIHHLGMPPTYAEFIAAMAEAGLCESDFQD